MAQPTITPYKNGPYLIRGDFEILDQDGNEIPTRRKTVALCRCGRSAIKPFCDGTHKLAGFEAASGPTTEADSHGHASAAAGASSIADAP